MPPGLLLVKFKLFICTVTIFPMMSHHTLLPLLPLKFEELIDRKHITSGDNKLATTPNPSP